MARITKKFTVTIHVLDDHADSVDETVIAPFIESGLEDEDIDAKVEVDPENAED